MREITDLRAGVVGTGFIGVVHVDALRRLGVRVAGVVGSSPTRAEAKRVAPVYESYEALLADDGVDVVHLTTPRLAPTCSYTRSGPSPSSRQSARAASASRGRTSSESMSTASHKKLQW